MRPALLPPGPRPPTARPSPKRSFAFALVGLAVALSGSAAWAAEGDGDDPGYANYFELQFGAVHVPNQTLDAGPSGHGRVEPDEVGFHVGGAFGRRVTDFVRAEIAFNYREGDVDQGGFASGSQADGKTSVFAAMANVYADLDLDWIVPWAGVGIGVGEYKIDVFQKTAGAVEIDDADAVFVYNAMVGATIPLNEVVEFNFGYRYFAVAGDQDTGAIIAPSTTTQQIDSEFDSHEGIFGVRLNF